MKKHTIRYLIILVVGIILLYPTFTYSRSVISLIQSSSSDPLGLLFIYSRITYFIFSYPVMVVLAWFIALDKERSKIGWLIGTALVPPLFLVLLLLPYTSFRKAIIDS